MRIEFVMSGNDVAVKKALESLSKAVPLMIEYEFNGDRVLLDVPKGSIVKSFGLSGDDILVIKESIYGTLIVSSIKHVYIVPVN